MKKKKKKYASHTHQNIKFLNFNYIKLLHLGDGNNIYFNNEGRS